MGLIKSHVDARTVKLHQYLLINKVCLYSVHCIGMISAYCKCYSCKMYKFLPSIQEAMEGDEEELAKLPWWKAKKWALHILCRVFER